MPRPKLNPTKEQRQQVEFLAAIGVRQEEIAEFVGIRSPKTLRKHFRAEIDRGATRASFNVGMTLYKMATSGQHPAATIFWMKTRCGWRERAALEPPTVAPPALNVIVEQEVIKP